MERSAAKRRGNGDAAGGALSEQRDRLDLEEFQCAVDHAMGGGVRVRDAAWLTRFRLHHRQASRYRNGRVFVAGDAGHIHSPVGAQGMNVGIQDAWNLGWKLALVAGGAADPALLDSYEAERWPIGRALLRYTDRLFSFFVRVVLGGAVAAWFRRTVVARFLPAVLRSERLRAVAFRLVSEVDINYRGSPAVVEGKPRLGRGPRAGDRLPDARVSRDDRATHLQQELDGAHLHLLLCGPCAAWEEAAVAAIADRFADVLVVRPLTQDGGSAPHGALVDAGGEALTRLGVIAGGVAQYLVRPDGYVGFRCGGTDLRAVSAFLQRLFPDRRGPTRAR